MRKVAKPHRDELDASAVACELHIYGQVINIGRSDSGDSYQHRGLGMKLLQEAEHISKEELGVNKIAVISAVGTRQYYKSLATGRMVLMFQRCLIIGRSADSNR